MTEFLPLLFAGDINVYSMARAFYEAYGIKAHVFGKYPAWPCHESRIMHYTANGKADEQDTFMEIVEDFAKEHRDMTILLLGCGDSYVRLISANKSRLPKNIIAPYVSVEMMDDLINKEKFYRLCEEAGVDYPETFIHRKEMALDFDLPFEGPFIIKPSNGIMYWQHPFPGQKKVFKEDTREDLEKVIKAIYDAGYEDSLVIQNFIPGDDTYMRVLTNYSDKNGQVKLMCLGHVLLEEHTPHGIGNHAVIITEQNEELEARFKKLLDGMGYVGFSNFDIKYDRRDGKYKVFEINCRQGRSNFYVTAAGANLAKIVTEDLIENKELEFASVSREHLWMVVPKGVAFKYIIPEEYRQKMRELIKAGDFTNPLYYSEDGGLKRKMTLAKSQLSHYIKYKKYMP